MTQDDFDPAELAGLFEHWLPGQRWYAGKSRPVESIRTRRLGTFGTAPTEVQVCLADVAYVDGGQETYQVPLRVGSRSDDALDHARVGQLSGPDGQSVDVYDAMWDKPHSREWLRALTAGIDTDTDSNTTDSNTDTAIRFHLSADAGAVPSDSGGRVLTGEQSNTSVVFGDTAILKVFRRLEVGTNPDIEIHEALGGVGGRHIARLLGSVTADLDGEHVSLAMVQEFMSGATDGWELAKNSVRDLMAEADLHAEEAGGDFASEAFRLGIATAEVHADLVTALGQQSISTEEMRIRADAMLERLDRTLLLVPDLAAVADGLRECYEAFAAAPPMTVQRVHGDLHLGQVLRTVAGWTVLDFEGEPVKSIASRREPDSPLRDVAGMLRSFDYAGYHQIVDSGATSQSNYRAAEWADRNREAFLAGYAHAAGTSEDPDGAAVLIRAFEADKAVYEAAYEARNRPAWLAVPLASLGRLVAPSHPTRGEDVR